jgi:hypothetical protein
VRDFGVNLNSLSLGPLTESTEEEQKFVCPKIAANSCTRAQLPASE